MRDKVSRKANQDVQIDHRTRETQLLPAGDDNARIAPDRLSAQTGKALFVSGQEGYHTYRIPALLSTPPGIDTRILRRSTWGKW